jgi:ABC-type Fe3+/spermidine/putrescine transport system ATPase subunit
VKERKSEGARRSNNNEECRLVITFVANQRSTLFRSFTLSLFHPLLEALSLSKSFSGEVRAVRRVSLRLLPGQIIGLVGASGSGKSTLLNLLAGLADADAGEVRLDGERVPGPSEVLMAGHPAIRLVHQEYQLMPNVSVRQNIAYAIRFYEKTYQDFRVNELLRICRLEAVQDRTPKQISGGEKQRVAIARAVAEKPRVLLFDEPFAHLDLPNRMVVRSMLLDLVRHDPEQRTACLFVTHDATDALSIADELGVMQHGQVIQQGTPQTLYRHPKTAYVARMTGPANIIRGKHLPELGLPADANPEAGFCIRPEQIQLSESGGVMSEVRAVFFKGAYSEVEVRVSRYMRLLVISQKSLTVGEHIALRIQPESLIRVQ